PNNRPPQLFRIYTAIYHVCPVAMHRFVVALALISNRYIWLGYRINLTDATTTIYNIISMFKHYNLLLIMKNIFSRMRLGKEPELKNKCDFFHHVVYYQQIETVFYSITICSSFTAISYICYYLYILYHIYVK